MSLDNLLSGVIGGLFGGICSVIAVLLQSHLKVREDRGERELHVNMLSVRILPKLLRLLTDLNNKRTMLEWDKKRDEIPFMKYDPATIANELKIEIPLFLDEIVKNAHVWGAKDGAQLAQIMWWLDEYNDKCDHFLREYLRRSLENRLPMITDIEQTSIAIVEMIDHLLPSIRKRAKQITG
jgi:hypothetical protein